MRGSLFDLNLKLIETMRLLKKKTNIFNLFQMFYFDCNSSLSTKLSNFDILIFFPSKAQKLLGGRIEGVGFVLKQHPCEVLGFISKLCTDL